MTRETLEIEGTWEQVMTLAPSLAGRQVRLTVLNDLQEHPHLKERPLEEVIAELVADVPDEEWAKLPPDLSDNLDHYIYGIPRQK